MVLFDNQRMFYMVSVSPSHNTVCLSSRKYHNPVEVELVFRYVVYMEACINYHDLKIENVEDEGDVQYLVEKIEDKYARFEGFREGDSLGKHFYMEKFIKSRSIKFFRLVSTDFSGYICCSSFDVFEDKVKVFSTKDPVKPD